jgi:hypothetical protein
MFLLGIRQRSMRQLSIIALISLLCLTLLAPPVFGEVIAGDKKGSLVASTFLGGSSLGADGFEYVQAMTADSEGNIYLVGCTNSADFPAVGGNSYDNYPSYDIFVAKMNSDLTELLASTVIGGNQWDQAFDLKIGPDGKVYIVGVSNSLDYPVTENAYDTEFNGNTTYVNNYYHSGQLPNYDTVITRLSADLTTLEASTFLGGANSDYNGEEYGGRDYAYSLDFDSNGDVYVLGTTESMDFPSTDGTCKDDTILYGDFTRDIYLCKLSSDLQTLKASTLITGSGDESVAKLLIDENDNIYITGNTTSLDLTARDQVFKTNRTAGAISAYEYNKEGFISVLDGNLTVTNFGYLGGNDSDTIHDMIIAANGDLLIGGSTQSINFPITDGVFKQPVAGSADAFITRMSGDLSNIVASTVLGGSKGEHVAAIVENAEGKIFIAGSTQSVGYPVTEGAFSTFMIEKVEASTLNNQDVFISKLSADLSSLEASTFIGNSDKDQLNNMILLDDYLIISGLAEASSNYLVGGVITNGTCNYPVVAGAYDTTFNGGRYDVFISKMDQSLSATPGNSELPSWNDEDAITASDITTNSLLLSWPQAINASGYKVLVDGLIVGTSTSDRSYGITDLDPGSTYELSVQAVNSDGAAVAIPHSLTVNTMDTSAPQGADVLVAMISPLVYQVEDDPDYVNQAIDPVVFGDELTLSLEFSGPGTIKNVTTDNIIFYKKDTPANPIPITLSPSGTLTKSSGYIVDVVISGDDLEYDAEYVLQIKYDEALNTNIQGNNSAKVIGKNVYYYLKTADDALNEADEIPPYWSSEAELSVTNKVGNKLQLNWPAATDNVAVTSYLVYQDQKLLGSTDKPYYQVSNLVAGKSYNFRVVAVDFSGNASITGLTLTAGIDFSPVFLTSVADDGKAYGIDIQPTFRAAFLAPLNAEKFSELIDAVVLERLSDSSLVSVIASLEENNQLINIVPQADLEYDSTYKLKLSPAIESAEGCQITGKIDLEFSTVDIELPVVAVYQSDQPVSRLEAGQDYTIKVRLKNPLDRSNTSKVIIVLRTGKGARLEYGGDVFDSHEQNCSIEAGSNYELTYNFTLPDGAENAAYLDLYTMNEAGTHFKSNPVHEEYGIE